MAAMQGRARFHWPEALACNGKSPSARRDAARPKAKRPKAPVAGKLQKLLEGFCADSHEDERIAVNSNGSMLFLPVAGIEWLEAADGGVTLHVGKATHVVPDTFAAMAAKLPSGRFMPLSPTMLVNAARIKELKSIPNGGNAVLLDNGTRLIVLYTPCGSAILPSRRLSG
jgi:DNA-binding LytR/AlgR family response regulator